MGSVDSLDPLYRDCHLVINPAVAGTGVKIKTLEALAHHRPVVTWRAGVDGLSPELRTLCVVVQNWYEFYLEVSKLIDRHPEETFSRKMRDRTRIALSGSTAYAPLVEILDHHLREATPMMNAEQAWTAPSVEAPGFAP